jgi:hypothetical protein
MAGEGRSIRIVWGNGRVGAVGAFNDVGNLQRGGEGSNHLST